MIDWVLASAGKFYGFDWAAMTFSFLQLYTLGSRKRHGFLLGIGANICWFIFGVLSGSLAQMIANIIFASINIRGYILWKR